MKADVHPNLAEFHRPQVAQLGKVLDEETARPQSMEIIRPPIEWIDVYPAKEQGKCAAILAAAAAH